ncbi:DNA repair protein complementing XP-A cells homolog isoform X1 [Argopecten irradians]|uniref:DNA repair protein complementing XP-A cells homolog isoform X1 n=1 Tax=Argopecten irradians TaxID=31199 RepID=UPI00371E6180
MEQHTCTTDQDNVEEKNIKKLSDAQRARIEKNRQRALMLKQTRLSTRPYSTERPGSSGQKVKAPAKVVDTGAGFFLEEEEEEERNRVKVKHAPGPVIGVDNLLCENCEKEFMDSYLHTHFDVSICDKCKENEDDNPLITKTDAKNRYLLKDADFDRREPPLKFIVRKNPRHDSWGDMKLFYEPQVYQRAMEVWGSEASLEEAHEKRTENREKSKQRKFDKKVKELRHAVRSSLIKKDRGPHIHEFGDEVYNEANDEYSKTCQTCGHVSSYEKM